MKDTNRLYDDTRKFHMQMRYYLEQNCLPRYEYIECAEPQARGAWHMHVVMIFVEEEQVPFIPNGTIEKIWLYGFTKIRKLTSVDNVGCYLTAYLSDMELSDAIQKGAVKGDLKAATVTDEHGDKYNGSIVKTKIWQKISEPDISKLFCYATRVTRVK